MLNLISCAQGNWQQVVHNMNYISRHKVLWLTLWIRRFNLRSLDCTVLASGRHFVHFRRRPNMAEDLRLVAGDRERCELDKELNQLSDTELAPSEDKEQHP